MGSFRTWTLALVAVTLGGCASVAGGGSSSGPDGSGSDVITREDLERTSAETAMEAVSLLRPQWLRKRPARTPGDPEPVVGVVVDGRPRGTLDDLASLRTAAVEQMVFLSATDATIRYGTGFAGGAIVVTTRSGDPGG